MADTIQVRRAGGYTTIQNSMIVDKRLSLKTRGLMAVILSRPEGWDYSVRGLAAFCGVGRDAVRTSLDELEKAGYLTREQSHSTDGKFGGNVYIIKETSETETPPTKETAAPLPENPATAEPLPENPATAEPLPEKPLPEKPSPENPTQRNKDLKNNTPLTPQGGHGGSRRKKAPRDAPDWKPDRFAGMWSFYPQRGRQNKQDAMKAWDDLKPDDALIATIGRALRKLKATDLWRRDLGIPYVATFLRNERWKDADELDEPEDGQQADVVVERRDLPLWT